jgi:ATP-dependent Zn protease
MRESARRATAFHEAGHIGIAWRSSLNLHKTTVIPGESLSGQAFNASPASVYLSRRESVTRKIIAVSRPHVEESQTSAQAYRLTPA